MTPPPHYLSFRLLPDSVLVYLADSHDRRLIIGPHEQPVSLQKMLFSEPSPFRSNNSRTVFKKGLIPCSFPFPLMCVYTTRKSPHFCYPSASGQPSFHRFSSGIFSLLATPPTSGAPYNLRNQLEMILLPRSVSSGRFSPCRAVRPIFPCGRPDRSFFFFLLVQVPDDCLCSK